MSANTDQRPTEEAKQTTTRSLHRGNPIFDRFFSQIVIALQEEDGAFAYEIFIKSLDKAAEGKGKL